MGKRNCAWDFYNEVWYIKRVIASNLKGSISFARSGVETRSGALFINLIDNSWLDTLTYAGVKGFPAFGNVIRGMDVVESIYSGYSDSTLSKLDTMLLNRSQFLEIFPKLDVIHKAYILKKKMKGKKVKSNDAQDK